MSGAATGAGSAAGTSAAGRTSAASGTSAAAAAVLRASIADGELAPGTKLSEEALAAELGVSRNTLREAFAVLAGERIITRIPNRGVFVASPGPEQVRELYAARRLLEPAAVLWGDAVRVRLLREIVGSAERALEAGDAAAMGQANQRFHEELISSAGSTQAEEWMAQILAQMRLVFHAMADSPSFHAHYVTANAALVEVLEAGDRAHAAEQLRTYLSDAEAHLLRALGE